MKYLKLHYVAETATGKGNNQFFEMKQLDEERFKWTKGYIGITIGRFAPKSGISPMCEWDNVLLDKTSKGWMIYSDHELETKKIVTKCNELDGTKYRPIDDPIVDDLVKRLWSYADASMKENYSVKVTDIPQEMLDKGRVLLNELSLGKTTLSDAEFTNKLNSYFAVIPRRMHTLTSLRNTKGNSSLEKRETILSAEENLYDFLLNQIKAMHSEEVPGLNKSIFDAFDIFIRQVTEEEKSYVMGLVDDADKHRVVNIYRVVNNMTENRFNKWNAEHGTEDKISHLWHGSYSRNWWSIITNGLWIKPNVCTANGMFGYGLYFAPCSNKSMGYVDGGCWKKGSNSKVYLALNKVATGDPFYYYRAQDYGVHDQCLAGIKKRGCHSLWAENRSKNPNSYLARDEVIIYEDAQVTIEYLVELNG